MTPAVSVVIPTRNRRPRVLRAVASVLEQTVSDFEVIVVDGDSQDGTCEALAGIDERVRCVRAPRLGPGAARNAGIRLARGPVVAFLDADNRWLPDHLEVVHALLERHPEAVLATTCPDFRASGSEEPHESRLDDALPTALLANRVGYVSGVAARRDVLLEVGGFDEDMLVGEDDDLWLRMAVKGPFAVVRRRTIVRRHTRGGLRDRGRSDGSYTEANTRSVARVMEELERLTGPRRDELVPRAQARLHVLAAVRALERHDQETARTSLEEACTLLPLVGLRADLVLVQIWKSTRDRGELARRLEAAAAAMPNQAYPSPLYFRGYASGIALTRGRLVTAARLVLRRPHLLRRSYMSWAIPTAAIVTRDRFVEIVRSRAEA